ncbi:MFS transporter [Paraburkholderia fungorum]|uniref:General substrate transporter n=1 Tax=Paraburkholderia fungorum TaxID=134537 RepID=A0A3R7EVT3_9BURK|nr:MFS transporter [Paraburkholderia fungorum]RKF50120.1 general substrate transporter [Paraburkholderia fungorum]
MTAIAVSAPERMSRALRWAPRLVAFGEFIDGYDLLCMGAALLFLKPHFNLDGSTIGWLGAIGFLGSALGLIVFGDMADRFGRKVIFVINLACFVIAALASAFVSSVWELMLARFVIGVAVGMDIPTSQSFLAEIAPGERRGRLAGSLPNMMWLGGAIASVLITMAIQPYTGENTWRWLFGLAALPALGVLIARQYLPESPRWLITQGRLDEARKITDALGLPMPAAKSATKRDYRILLSGHPLRKLAATTAFCTFQAFAGAVATIAGPLVFSTAGFQVGQSLYFALGSFILGFIGVALGSLVIDRVNRRTLGIAACLCNFACGVGIAVLGTKSVPGLFCLYMIFSMMSWFGPATLSWVWCAEAAPTQLRGVGSAIPQCAMRLVIALNVIMTPALVARFGIQVIGFYVLSYLAAAIVIGCSPFLDSAGVELEEMDSV